MVTFFFLVVAEQQHWHGREKKKIRDMTKISQRRYHLKRCFDWMAVYGEWQPVSCAVCIFNTQNKCECILASNDERGKTWKICRAVRARWFVLSTLFCIRRIFSNGMIWCWAFSSFSCNIGTSGDETWGKPIFFFFFLKYQILYCSFFL
jgi:hypothetical protein